MNQSRKKHAILIILLILIAVMSTKYMTDRSYGEKKNKITIVLPKNRQDNLSSVQEGIRDYAYEHQIFLDVWYEEQMSEKELENLVTDEKENQSIGILLIYPELYLERKTEGYTYDNMMALTDTMQNSFKHYASFIPVDGEAYRMPVKEDILEQVRNGEREAVYIQNTYELGYESLQMIEAYGKRKQMENISLQPVRVDKEIIEDGSLDALLAK